MMLLFVSWRNKLTKGWKSIPKYSARFLKWRRASKSPKVIKLWSGASKNSMRLSTLTDASIVFSIKRVTMIWDLTFDRWSQKHNIVETPMLSTVLKRNLRLNHFKGNFMAKCFAQVIKHVIMGFNRGPGIEQHKCLCFLLNLDEARTSSQSCNQLTRTT